MILTGLVWKNEFSLIIECIELDNKAWVGNNLLLDVRDYMCSWLSLIMCERRSLTDKSIISKYAKLRMWVKMILTNSV